MPQVEDKNEMARETELMVRTMLQKYDLPKVDWAVLMKEAAIEAEENKRKQDEDKKKKVIVEERGRTRNSPQL